MVKHIILWTLKEMSDSEKESVKAGIKEGLEGYSKHHPVKSRFVIVYKTAR